MEQQTVDRMTVLMDGPPPRVPKRLDAGSHTKGERMLVNAEDGSWVADQRAVDDPYWMDEATHTRWAPHTVVDGPPEGFPAARLFVAVCREPDWYAWQTTKRRPEVREYPAYLVFRE